MSVTGRGKNVLEGRCVCLIVVLRVAQDKDSALNGELERDRGDGRIDWKSSLAG